jgi:DNA helicase-2/ATP-dependent DNA helicase PcrA
MRSRDFIDYDDMILAALRVLENDSARRIEQNQVFAVFEDEAQDSSPLQTQLLEILATDVDSSLLTPHSPLPTPHSALNLVRVGDPNQAINSTFYPSRSDLFSAILRRVRSHQTIGNDGSSWSQY